jgi:hypothetical protein
MVQIGQCGRSGWLACVAGLASGGLVKHTLAAWGGFAAARPSSINKSVCSPNWPQAALPLTWPAAALPAYRGTGMARPSSHTAFLQHHVYLCGFGGDQIILLFFGLAPALCKLCSTAAMPESACTTGSDSLLPDCMSLEMC